MTPFKAKPVGHTQSYRQGSRQCRGLKSDNRLRSGQQLAPAADCRRHIQAIVSSQITQDGSVISGDTTEVVTIAVDPGYADNPGHPGTGTVIGIVCGDPGGGILT